MRSSAQMESLTTDFTTFPASHPPSILGGSMDEDVGVEQNEFLFDNTSPVQSQNSEFCSAVTSFPLGSKRESTESNSQSENSTDERSPECLSESLMCDMSLKSTLDEQINCAPASEIFKAPSSLDPRSSGKEMSNPLNMPVNYEEKGNDEKNPGKEMSSPLNTSLNCEEKVNDQKNPVNTSLNGDKKVNDYITPEKEDIGVNSSDVASLGPNTKNADDEITPENEDTGVNSPSDVSSPGPNTKKVNDDMTAENEDISVNVSSDVLSPGPNSLLISCSGKTDQSFLPNGKCAAFELQTEWDEISQRVKDIIKEEIDEEEFEKEDRLIKEEVEDNKTDNEESEVKKSEKTGTGLIVEQNHDLSSHSSLTHPSILHVALESSESNSSNISNQDPGAVPSCSGTSSVAKCAADLLQSSSDNESDNEKTLKPNRKRKWGSTEVVSVSDGDSKDEIDYSNLTAEQIKQIVEDARRLARNQVSRSKKCKCPKKKWSELPIIGPTKPSGVCHVGRGDWRIKPNVECPNCAAGICDDVHPVRMKRRSRRLNRIPRRAAVPRLVGVPRLMGTIGRDVPVIDITDDENEEAPDVDIIASEITVSSVRTEQNDRVCVVVSSSDDDDDIVCEAVIKQPPRKIEAPEAPEAPETGLNELSAELSQDANRVDWSSIDLENFSDTLDLLGYLVDSPNATTTTTTVDNPSCSASSTSMNTPNTPATPETAEAQDLWSCPICLETKKDVAEIMSTNCGHVFCGDCIRNAVKMTHKCPTCRKRLTVKQFHKIFI